MSLRVRLAIFFAGIAAVAAALMGVLSYAVTAERLAREADVALAQAAEPYVAALREGRSHDGDRRPDGRDDRLGQYPVQVLRPDGTAVPLTLPGVELPVNDEDLALAGSDTPQQRFRTDDYNGTPIRMLTESAGTGAGAIQVARDWAESAAVLRALSLTLLLIGAGVALLAAVGGWVLARRLTGRLIALTEAAETVGATSRLDLAVPGGGSDEVGRLATSFDLMLQRLAASRQEQQRLVQDAGHELRTPLTSLRTNVSLLRHFEQLPAADRERVLADLSSETKELTALVNEIVELGVEAPLNPQPEPVVLADVAAAAVARAQRRTGRTVELQADDSVVLGSPAALERAIWNLIDNAAKFAPDGPIEVRVSVGTVAVTDHGPGIAEADLPRIFGRFSRSTDARALPGSGLGLAIVSEVARTHGGEVFARNLGEADGSTGAEVGMRLPLAPRETEIPFAHL